MTRVVTVFLALLGASLIGNAGAIDVAYTVSGSAGAWDLNFSVTNNLNAWPAQDIYEFGVALSSPGITGSPTGYSPSGTVTNQFLGGSSILYNNVWVDLTDFNHLFPGTTLPGFTVQIADATAPTSVSWFAYTADVVDFTVYDGTDSFANGFDGFSSGFEGLASPASDGSTVPEPSTLAFVVIGLGGGLFLRRKAIRG